MQNKNLQLALKIIISCALTALLVKDLNQETSVEGLLNIISNTTKSSVFVFAFLCICSLIIRSYRYYYALSVINEKQLEFYKILAVCSIRNLTVDLLPARLGELSYFILLKFYGISLTSSSAVFITCFILDFFVLATIGMLFLSSANLHLFLVLLTILFSASYLLLKVPKVLSYLEKRYNKLLLADNFEKLQKFKTILRLTILTFALRLSKYTSLYILLRGALIGSNFDLSKFEPVQCTIAFILAEASASLPASGIMGFGAYEKTWSALMQGHGTLSIIFCVHIISQLVNYSLSGICSLIFLFKQDKEN